LFIFIHTFRLKTISFKTQLSMISADLAASESGMISANLKSGGI
jgi:hypothetical protein